MAERSMLPPGLPVDGKPHSLTLGDSFSYGSSNAFHTIRYDFKPASVDTQQEATLDVSEKNSVTVDVPHVEGSGTSHTRYKGNKRPTQKECVLIINPVTGELTLEKISSTLTMKKTSVPLDCDVTLSKVSRASNHKCSNAVDSPNLLGEHHLHKESCDEHNSHRHKPSTHKDLSHEQNTRKDISHDHSPQRETLNNYSTQNEMSSDRGSSLSDHKSRNKHIQEHNEQVEQSLDVAIHREGIEQENTKVRKHESSLSRHQDKKSHKRQSKSSAQDGLLCFARGIRSDIKEFLKDHKLENEIRPHITASMPPEQLSVQNHDLYRRAELRLKVTDKERDSLVQHLCRNYDSHLGKNAGEVYARLQRLEDVMDFVLQKYFKELEKS